MTTPRIHSLLAIAAAAVALALLPSAASARSKYCSTSGDVCYAALHTSPVKLRITLAAHYFSRYRLCVTNPHGVRECHRFRIRKQANGFYGSTVSWPKHFEYGGKGTYRARWFQGGNALGPAVKF